MRGCTWILKRTSIRSTPSAAFSQLETHHLRHFDISQHDVWRNLERLFQRDLPVAALRDDADVILEFEECG